MAGPENADAGLAAGCPAAGTHAAQIIHSARPTAEVDRLRPGFRCGENAATGKAFCPPRFEQGTRPKRVGLGFGNTNTFGAGVRFDAKFLAVPRAEGKGTASGYFRSSAANGAGPAPEESNLVPGKIEIRKTLEIIFNRDAGPYGTAHTGSGKQRVKRGADENSEGIDRRRDHSTTLRKPAALAQFDGRVAGRRRPYHRLALAGWNQRRRRSIPTIPGIGGARPKHIPERRVESAWEGQSCLRQYAAPGTSDLFDLRSRL